MKIAVFECVPNVFTRMVLICCMNLSNIVGKNNVEANVSMWNVTSSQCVDLLRHLAACIHNAVKA